MLGKKGQVLANFLAEIPQPETCSASSNWWTLSIDRASLQTRARHWSAIKSLGGDKIEKAIRMGFSASKNESEYEVILDGIEVAVAISDDKLIIRSDSQLVVGQVNAEYESRDPRMVKYVILVKQRLASFSAWKLEHVPRDCNEREDALAAVATSLPITETIFMPIYYQSDSSIATIRVSRVGDTSPSWMDPIAQYINTGKLPNEKDKAHKVRVQFSRFSLIDGQLFKQSLNGPYLKCSTTEQGQYVLVEFHEGICGNHPGGRTLAHKAHT